jgi:hypothetical protein
MLQSLSLIDALSSACWKNQEKKRERERRGQGCFFLGPEARHVLLAVLGGIYMAVRCNQRLI